MKNDLDKICEKLSIITEIPSFKIKKVLINPINDQLADIQNDILNIQESIKDTNEKIEKLIGVLNGDTD